MKETVDVVVPFYNPSRGWDKVLMSHFNDLQAAGDGFDFHLILVDDGSFSMPAFELELKAVEEGIDRLKLIRTPANAGKGAALRKGISASESMFTMFTDVDFPYTIESMLEMLRPLEGGANVTLGNRKNDYYMSVPWFRKGLSELFRFVLTRILNFPITDTQCGLKAMDEAGRKVFLCTRVERFLVDMEFIKLAARESQLKMLPVTVHLRPDVTFSKMGFAVLLREGLNFLKIIFR